MKVVGTICEYNPFHNGHLYHLKKIKEISNCDCLVVVLSTYFTMRGEISLHSPFEKTNYALSEADIVVALPSVLACNSAEHFAYYAVRELAKLDVTELYFGSEEANILLYEEAYRKYKEIENTIKDDLKSNLSYKNIIDLNLAANDLLGFCYYKAIKENNYNLKINVIKRHNSIHGELTPNNEYFTSSSAIRNNINLIDKYCPSFISKKIYDYNKLFNYLKYNSLIIKKYQSKFISEGIENLIKKNLKLVDNFDDLINLSCNKRYSKSRIKRAIFHMFINDNYNDNYTYSRILGFNEKGRNYLNLIKDKCIILTKIKYNICDILDYELALAEIIDLIYQDNNYHKEITKPIIR